MKDQVENKAQNLEVRFERESWWNTHTRETYGDESDVTEQVT